MAQSTPQSWRKVPRSVVALGLVALFMDTSSELVFSLLPLFLVDALHASMVTVGILEGGAGAIAAIAKVFSGVISDRIGKGIRGAPRDALVADITPPDIRGAAFGLRQALDTVGAFAGPLLAMALMVLSANDFRAVFWWAVVPGAIAVVLLIFGVQEPAGTKPSGQRGWPIRRADLARMNKTY